mmetsp:Transcript_123918/g.264197  ORF Transcript_123918/g.264197 Transcript_123918/m.264197 type:complete len:87 (+) Transcript_123918:231-491(+)
MPTTYLSPLPQICLQKMSCNLCRSGWWSFRRVGLPDGEPCEEGVRAQPWVRSGEGVWSQPPTGVRSGDGCRKVGSGTSDPMVEGEM